MLIATGRQNNLVIFEDRGLEHVQVGYNFYTISCYIAREKSDITIVIKYFEKIIRDLN